MEVRVVPATLEHARTLAATLRPGDRLEVEASGMSPYEALAGSIDHSIRSEALLVGDELLLLYGYSTPHLLTDTVNMWMLSGEPVDRHRKTFLRWSREAIARVLSEYACAWNLVDARYTAAIRWAKWLGFTVHDPVPFGVNGEPFHPIMIRR